MFPQVMALNLQAVLQAPHWMHFAGSIRCGSFFSPMMAPTGHLRTQAVQPLHSAVVIVGGQSDLHWPAGHRLWKTCASYSARNWRKVELSLIHI